MATPGRAPKERPMRYKSLQEFIAAAAAVGEVKEVHGADLTRDVGCLT